MKQKHRYANLDNINTKKTFTDFRRWQKERRSNKKDLKLKIEQAPIIEVEKLHHNDRSTSITWIGHSTFLIQMNGLNMLTDPVWANRMGFQKTYCARNSTI